MINIKTMDNIAGDENWPFIGSVFVHVNSSDARKIPKDASQAQAEEIVQSWQKVAVLKVVPDMDVYFGFQVDNHMQFLNASIKKENGLFGARVGDGDVRFFVIPKDLKSRPSLELVDIVDIQDKNYINLPLY